MGTRSLTQRTADWLAHVNTLKQRADDAERQLTEQRQIIEGMERRFQERAALISIVREGRKVRFLFVRNGELFPITMFGTWDDDIEEWKRQLLEPVR